MSECSSLIFAAIDKWRSEMKCDTDIPDCRIDAIAFLKPNNSIAWLLPASFFCWIKSSHVNSKKLLNCCSKYYNMQFVFWYICFLEGQIMPSTGSNSLDFFNKISNKQCIYYFEILWFKYNVSRVNRLQIIKQSV